MAEKKEHIHIRLTAGLKREIDGLAGLRKRSAFFQEAAERELKRRRLAAAKSEQIQMQEASEARVSIN
jgi:metal-responsive CopG/Arc/MetJ family transcriptional regulator